MRSDEPKTTLGQLAHAISIAGIVGLSPFGMIPALFIGYCHQVFDIQIVSLEGWVLAFWLMGITIGGAGLYRSYYRSLNYKVCSS